MNYQQAMSHFCEDLLMHPAVKDLTEYYGRTAEMCVSALKCRFYTNCFQDGSVKKIQIFWTDLGSGIKVYHSINYENR